MTETELSSNIEKLDKPGREKFKQLCKNLGFEYGEPTNNKLAYDCYIEYKGKKFIVEIKDRDLKYEKYQEMILEKDKHDRIMHWKDKLKVDGAYYCCWFGNAAYIWNLDDSSVTSKPEKKWMNNITAASRSIKVEKDIYMIDKANAKKYQI